MADTKKFMIVAYCNPYHAKFHHHGERVLKYESFTPIKWVHTDNYGNGFTNDEALAEMEKMLQYDDSCFYYDREYILECKAEDELYDDSWFEGDGWYDINLTPIYIKNSGVIRDDVMTYTIEEYEPKMYRVTYEDGTDDYFYYPDDITARDEHCDDDRVIEIAEVDAHIETFPTINIIFS